MLIYPALILALSFSIAFAGSGQNVGHDDSAIVATQGNAQLTGTPDAAQGAVKKYWCERSVYHKKRIENAQYEVDKETELLSELSDEVSMETGRDKKFIENKITKTQDKLTSAQKQLKDRQSDFARIEDEARRKNIPSGWLQCPSAW